MNEKKIALIESVYVCTFTAILGSLRHKVQRNEHDSYVNKDITDLIRSLLTGCQKRFRNLRITYDHDG